MKDIEKSESLPPLMPATSVDMKPIETASIAPGKENSDNSVGGFGKLAKRITGITSNCLFTAIVLVAGLGIGRQILRWWSDDAPPQSVTPQNTALSGGLGDPGRLHVLQFGRQGWSMARREFLGSRADAEAQLRRDCREQIEKAAIPREKPTSEQETLLASLAKTPAIDAELPRWQLFAPDRIGLILVGVKPPLVKDSKRGNGDIGSAYVVLWGIALPKGEDAWSAIIFMPSAEGADAIPLLPDIPLPPKCRKMLSVQAVNGGAMVAFSGPGEVETWRGHFEKWLTKGGWKPVFPWQSTASAWYAQYRGQIKDKNIVVDLHFYPDGRGGMSGLVIVGVGDGD